MQSTNRKINPLLLIRSLFFVTAAVLFIFSAGTFMRYSQNPERMSLYLIYGFLMLVDSAAMLVCGLLIKRRRKPLFWFAAGVLGANILLTVIDQFGMIDFLFLLLNVTTLAILILVRKDFVI